MDNPMKEFFLVSEQILPEAIKKTIRAKAMIRNGEARTINEAVEMSNLSRSAYYKYKDYVFPFYEASRSRIITVSVVLESQHEVLMELLNTIHECGGKIMSIHQDHPIQGASNAAMDIDTGNLSVDIDSLLDKIRDIEGITRLRVIGIK